MNASTATLVASATKKAVASVKVTAGVTAGVTVGVAAVYAMRSRGASASAVMIVASCTPPPISKYASYA